ncbi:Utp9p ASCRUDRAFT_76873 [Ascoidea rubescens DSM 1968]|uniref:Small-subunit processome Utp12 domain-containing protein n=1 Tax=Ascoidea rubescens DSM 1968 TaxID=1344418 RepID=A0A1D2VE36_9ASCO|nr:hypothetical protein ASCRUDRAFT_76873 [Ascoidea rubescens DSM 1968]ODV59954.1 hypothetical protein ASCRUDRAFT_76873 [Ascoidea rubescens DSM 1968]
MASVAVEPSSNLVACFVNGKLRSELTISSLAECFVQEDGKLNLQNSLTIQFGLTKNESIKLISWFVKSRSQLSSNKRTISAAKENKSEDIEIFLLALLQNDTINVYSIFQKALIKTIDLSQQTISISFLNDKIYAIDKSLNIKSLTIDNKFNYKLEQIRSLSENSTLKRFDTNTKQNEIETCMEIIEFNTRFYLFVSIKNNIFLVDVNRPQDIIEAKLSEKLKNFSRVQIHKSILAEIEYYNLIFLDQTDDKQINIATLEAIDPAFQIKTSKHFLNKQKPNFKINYVNTVTASSSINSCELINILDSQVLVTFLTNNVIEFFFNPFSSSTKKKSNLRLTFNKLNYKLKSIFYNEIISKNHITVSFLTKTNLQLCLFSINNFDIKQISNDDDVTNIFVNFPELDSTPRVIEPDFHNKKVKDTKLKENTDANITTSINNNNNKLKEDNKSKDDIPVELPMTKTKLKKLEKSKKLAKKVAEEKKIIPMDVVVSEAVKYLNGDEPSKKKIKYILNLSYPTTPAKKDNKINSINVKTNLENFIKLIVKSLKSNGNLVNVFVLISNFFLKQYSNSNKIDPSYNILSLWIKNLLLIHGGCILSNAISSNSKEEPNAINNIRAINNIINKKRASLSTYLLLQGRLNLLKSQYSLRSELSNMERKSFKGSIYDNPLDHHEVSDDGVQHIKTDNIVFANGENDEEDFENSDAEIAPELIEED